MPPRESNPGKAQIPKPPKINNGPEPSFTQMPKEFLRQPVLPHQLSFAAVWQAVNNIYLTLDDEAKKHNYQNALAMRRDASLFKSLRARQYPVAELPFTIDPDDPEDPEQVRIAQRLSRLIHAIPKFQFLKLHLLEAVWYGKAAVQLEWDFVRVDGERYLLPVKHVYVNGDKLVFDFDGTPGVLVYRPMDAKGLEIRQSNWGPALFLRDEYFRDRFVIHEHEPEDSDYLFDSALAGAIHGMGLRSRIYWVYQVRHQVLGWIVDSLQRVSSNGFLVGYYPAGNPSAQEAVNKALEDLIDKSVCSFPITPSRDNVSKIESIAPSTIAYDTMLSVVQYFDQIIEVMILGQNLSSGTSSTGMGSEVANLHSLTLERIVRYDACNLSETLTSDLLDKIIKYNFGDLGFNLKLKLTVEKTNIKDQVTAAKGLWDMGVPLDEENLRDQAGFVAPRDRDDAVVNEDPDKDFRVGDQDKVADTSLHTHLSRFEGSNCGTGDGGFKPGNSCGKGDGQGSNSQEPNNEAHSITAPESPPKPKTTPQAKRKLREKRIEHKDALRDLQDEHRYALKELQQDQKDALIETLRTHTGEQHDLQDRQVDDLKDFRGEQKEALQEHLDEYQDEPEEVRSKARKEFDAEQASEAKEFRDDQTHERDQLKSDQEQELDELHKNQEHELDELTRDQAQDLKELQDEQQSEIESLESEHTGFDESGDLVLYKDGVPYYTYQVDDDPPPNAEGKDAEFWKDHPYRILDSEGNIYLFSDDEETLDSEWDQLLDEDL